MTEKIIIDGVNVAECDMKCINSDCGLYYAEVYNTSNGLKYGFKCESNPDCHYKQLQRAKAELQELNKKYTEVLSLAKKNADSNEYCLQELEKENEKLKAEIMQMVDENYATTDWREMEDLKAENERLKEDKNKYYQQTLDFEIQISDLLQVLQEIKEILQNEHPFKDCSCGQDILAKISKVEK